MSVDASGWLRAGDLAVSPWVFGPAAFVLLVGAGWLVVWLVLRLVRRGGERHGRPASGTVTRALGLPLYLAVLVVGLLVLQRILPLSPSFDSFLSTAVRGAFVLLGIVLVERVVVGLMRLFAGRVTFIDLSQGIVRGLVRIAIFVVGGIILLDMLGVAITPLVASLGVASLAVALALQAPLANFFAGLMVLADKSLNPGDFVTLDSGEKGYIEKIGLRHTRIRMLPDEIVIVPNEKLLSSTVHNTSLPRNEISIRIQVGVHYDSDLEQVERVTRDVGRKVQQEVEGGVADWEPLIRFHTFDSSSINFTVILRVTDYVAGYLVKHEFIKALHARYRDEGIVIPFPLRTLDIPEKAAARLREALGGRGVPEDRQG